jgi:hypothetical protein
MMRMADAAPRGPAGSPGNLTFINDGDAHWG